MSLTNSPFWMAPTGGDFYEYTIDQSVRYGGRETTANYFTRNHTQTRTKWTCSWWVRHVIDGNSHRQFESKDNNGASGNYAGFTWQSDGKFHMFDYTSGYRIRLTTDRIFRDPTSWYHFVLRFDSTQSTASNRVRLYVNGEQVNWVTHTTYPSQNLSCQIGNGTTHYIGRYAYNSNSAMQGNFAEWIMVDNQSLDASNFGEYKEGIWVPKEYGGTYGTNGFKLNFSNASSLGTDSSGNSKNWTSQNMSSHDQSTDSPTNVFNRCMETDATGPGTLVEGGLRSYVTSQGNYYSIGTTIAVKNGKWYWESRSIRGGNNSSGLPEQRLLPDGKYCNSSSAPTDAISIGVGTQDGSDGVYMIAADLDNGYIYRGRNGSWSNGATESGIENGTGTGAVKTLTAAQRNQLLRVCVTHRHDTGTSNCLFNFGQDSTLEGYTSAGNNADDNGFGDFKYSPPSGFLAMCTQNLPDPDIDPASGDIPEDYFNTKPYSGTNATHNVTGVGFKPDWVWIKRRNASYNAQFFDAVRGAGANKELTPSEAYAEGGGNSGTYGYLSSFNTDGFTLTPGSTNSSQNNESGGTYVAWNWLAGNSTSSNTDGDITSTVSVNQEAGFSIVTYTGTGTVGDTVGHGLGSTPGMIIIKSRSGSGQQWATFHHKGSSTAGSYFLLNKTDAVATDNSMFNNVNPTSSVFTVTGGSGDTGRSGSTYVAYCFAEKEGYSKFGSYTGNGSSDGAVVFTGFRPAFVMVKRSNSSGSWEIMDNKRDPYNVVGKQLFANLSNSEFDGTVLDFLSNGFKLRDGSSNHNASGSTYIYMAFAEQPFKYANAR